MLDRRLSMKTLLLSGLLAGWAGGCSPELAPQAPKVAAAPGSAVAAVEAPGMAPAPAAAKPPADWTSLDRGSKPAAPPTALTEVLTHGPAFAGKVIRTTGVVDAACPGGCWLLVGQQFPGGPMRVLLEGADIKAPADAQGAMLDVQGTLAMESLPPEKAKLYEEERAMMAKQPPRPIPADPKEIVLRATGWSLIRSPEQASAAAASPPPLPPCAGGGAGDDLLGGGGAAAPR